MDDNLEYELIEISFGYVYELPEEEMTWKVCEDNPSDGDNVLVVEYDADGVPMGNTIPEIELRETIISDFLEKWGQANPDRGVLDDKLNEKIYVRGISVIEAKEHSSKSYESTRAIMIIDEVLKSASPIRRVPTKKGNKNQKDFGYMLIMIYKHPILGSIKVTVGVKKNTKKVQYGLTVLRSGQPLIDESLLEKTTADKKTKKRRSH